MAKTKVKVTVKTGRKGDAGTLVARIPVTVTKNATPRGEKLFQTKAVIVTHIRSASRPTTIRQGGTR